MIVGTAGHIDHGKTTLVRALTGVETDRLPEEKARGISIELGYAYLPAVAPDGSRTRIGFIDVPGHERLVHTMLAGASGIDLALLLMAADDGIMPQTREHLAVLSLLGVNRGAVVITKADRADAARVDEVAAAARDLLHGTTLDGSPVFVTAATIGTGIEALRNWLFAASGEVMRRIDSRRAFRLAIDRAFTLDGVGTVVTGTVHDGIVHTGDQLEVAPSGTRKTVRVRSLHAQNAQAESGHAGERCAVALVGIGKDDLERGQWLVTVDGGSVSSRLDVQLDVWHGEAAALRSGTPVHIHIGAATAMASVAVLSTDGADRIAPGQRQLAQLVVQRPLGAWRGDRVVLRNASASRTLAGGVVLDPDAPTRYRRSGQRLAELHAMQQPTAEQRWDALLAVCAHGVSLSAFRRAEGLTADWQPAAPAVTSGGADCIALAPQFAQHAVQCIAETLAAYHASHPDELGLDRGRLRRMATPRLPQALFDTVIAACLGGEHAQILRLAQRGAFLHLADHAVRLSSMDERIAQQIAAPLASAGFEGAWLRDLARDAGVAESIMRASIARLAQAGSVHQIVRDLVYPVATMQSLASIVRQRAAAADGEVSAAQLRDATQIGRKRAIQILEYFDRVGLSRRVGDTHRVRDDCALFAETLTR